MTIQNMSAMNMMLSKLKTGQTDTTNTFKKLSSGFQVNSAADNAAALAISESMRAYSGGLSKASENAQNGVSLVQTAEGGLSNSSDVLNRMRELAVQASNGTYSDSDRALLNQEFNQLKGSLDQIASSTNYNGIKLLDGSMDGGANGKDLTLQIGAQGSDDQQMSVRIGDMSSDALGLTKINLNSADSANSAIDAIEKAINDVSGTRGDLGAAQNRLTSTINNLETSNINSVAAESRIRDLDMAKGIMDQVRNSIQSQASTAVAAHGMNLMRQNVMSLLMR